VERIDRAIAGRFGRALLAADGQGDAPRGIATVRRRDAPADQLDRGWNLRRALLHEGHQVRVGDFLLRVGEGDRLAIDRVERLALDVVAELPQLALEAAPARELADRQLAAGQSHRLGRHDLVRQRVLDHAVLVDPALVREGVAAHDRLVRLDGEPGEIAHEPRRRRDLLGLDAADEVRELGRTGPDAHHDRFERRVAGSFAEGVYLDLDLAGAGLDGRKGVGRGETEVVVAVDAHGRVAPDEIDDPTDERPELARDRVADGVGDVDGRCAGRDDGLVDLEQEVRVRARGVLGAELDLGVVAERLAAEAHPADRLGQRFVARDPELVLQVDVARRNEDVEVGPLGDADRLDRPLRVAVAAAGEGRDRDGTLRVLGDPADGLEVAGRGGREAGLDDVDLEPGELAGDLELLGRG